MKDQLILLLLVALLLAVLWPRQGLIARWRTARRLAARTRQEDALKHILKAEVNGRPSSVASVAGALRLGENRAAALLAELERGGLLSFERGAPRLRPAGRELARHVIRAHRLWESFLADQTGISESEWHRQAERKEHLLSPAETDRLAAKLGNPLRDPHGDTIPADGEEVPADSGLPLTDVAAGERFEVVHMEDEPDSVYRQLLALGLLPGMHAQVEARSADHLDLLLPDQRRVRLNTVQANNVAVSMRPAFAAVADVALSELAPGGTATVVGLAPACLGAARRRLLDLGFVPGTLVSVELVSPVGDPTAYRVRGSVIALRRKQADLIRISPRQEAAA
ncbi:MAG: iron dependent repressor, metal binding and dimerization domain protein [Lacunisphaera sp.]|nr:iron dependent repressor, metal binding and dimerization domain protein [Lacunisphaera sp.]